MVSGDTWASADSTVTSRATDLDDLLGTKEPLSASLPAPRTSCSSKVAIQCSDDAVIEVNQAVTGGFDVDTDYEFYVNLVDIL